MTSTTTARKVGDLVGVDDPKFTGTWKIVKINPATMKLTPVTPAGEPIPGARGLVAHHGLIIDAPDPAQTGMDRFQATQAARPAGLRVGAIVRVSGKTGNFGPGQLFVVFADKFEIVNVVPLGGSPARRYWKVTPRHITVVDPATITAS